MSVLADAAAAQGRSGFDGGSRWRLGSTELISAGSPHLPSGLKYCFPLAPFFPVKLKSSACASWDIDSPIPNINQDQRMHAHLERAVVSVDRKEQPEQRRVSERERERGGGWERKFVNATERNCTSAFPLENKRDREIVPHNVVMSSRSLALISSLA